MTVISVKDFAYGRLRSPDLDVQEEFLTNFGMVRVERTKDRLYMRGTDPAHHIHITELGEPKFMSFGYHAASEEDLDRISRVEGASKIETIDEPGGGKRVRLTDPWGFGIEIIHGQARHPAPLPVRENVVNVGGDRLRRAGKLSRLPRRAAHVKRIGHGVLMTPDLPKTVAWYRNTLGLISSDDVYAGEKGNLIGSFNRLNCGDDYVDHHVFFTFVGPHAGLNHLSFEVEDIDDVMIGHEYLRETGKYKHVWGIGRHVLGSQVFDYWQDPWGRVHEHWTDTDVLNARHAPNLVSADDGLNSQWGDRVPQEFIEYGVR